MKRAVVHAVCGMALLVAAGAMFAGCAKKRPPTPPTRVEVINDSPYQQPTRRLASTTPTTRPLAPQPKLIEEGDRSTLIYPCKFARTEVLGESIEGLLSPEGTVSVTPALNTVIVSDRAQNVRSIMNVLDEIDRPVAQLLVEARIVEVAIDSDLEYEIEHLLTRATEDGASVLQSGTGGNFNTPGGTPTEGQGGLANLRLWESGGDSLDTFIRLLVTRGKAKILSSPNLIVSAGTEASIITGSEVPVQSSFQSGGSVATNTQFKRVGIKLRVLLQQIADDTARVEINPEVSTVTGFTAATEQVPANPIIAIRNVTSILSLKDGEILTVGGLLQNETRQTVRGIPILSDIPGVGLLFQSRRNTKNRTQLIFFLRVNILEEGRTYETRIHRPGDGMHLLDRAAGLVVPRGNGPYPVTADPRIDMRVEEE
ncbi:MAG TPA: secretin N-terminal domain-containing protein [Tepidisphaeraceae bacterium]|nr:secretin N-terminal domain-containing protein [Tepidisphaeraceae bacterium]